MHRQRYKSLDFNFKYETFITTLQSKRAKEGVKASIAYVEENIQNLQLYIKSSEQIKKIFDCIQDDAAYPLFTKFNAMWLKQFNTFYHLSRLGQFLNGIPVAYWESILKHLGHQFNSQVKPSALIEMTKAFSSSKKSEAKENDDACLVEKYQTLFKYAGDAWLCDPDRLGKLLNFENTRLFRMTLLNFLGEKIKNKITDGYRLGRVLEDIAEQSTANYSPTLFSSSESTPYYNAWKELLASLHPKWHSDIVNNRVNLNALLNQLDITNVPPYKIPFFLKSHLDKKRFTCFNHFIDLFKQDSEVANLHSLDHQKSIQFIEAFNENELYDIMLKGQNKSEVQKQIDMYHTEPFYNALKLAFTKACHFSPTSVPEIPPTPVPETPPEFSIQEDGEYNLVDIVAAPAMQPR